MANDPAKRPCCTAQTAKGTTCKNARLPGKMTCRQHTPNAGARVKLTDALIVETRRLAAKGLTIKDIAIGLGITQSTVYAWQRVGERDAADDHGDTLHAKFSDALSRGRAQAREKMVAVLMDAAVGYEQRTEKFDVKTGEIREVTEVVAKDWRAAAWYLERTDPENWRRRDADDPKTGQSVGEPADIVPEAERRDEILDVLRLSGALEAAQPQPPA